MQTVAHKHKKDHANGWANKKRDNTNTLYKRTILTRNIILSISQIGKHLQSTMNDYVAFHFEGKCLDEGIIKPNSSKIISYSALEIKGSDVFTTVVFECEICQLVAGMVVPCIVKAVVKSGLRAESATDVPSPIVVFLPKELHLDHAHFSQLKPDDKINVRIYGIRYELYDRTIEVIAELVN